MYWHSVFFGNYIPVEQVSYEIFAGFNSFFAQVQECPKVYIGEGGNKDAHDGAYFTLMMFTPGAQIQLRCVPSELSHLPPEKV